MLPSLRKNKWIFLVFAFAFLVPSSTTAQNSTQPLIEVLKLTEKRFDVRFSYTHTNIENRDLVAPGSDLSLQETLTFLTAETGLKFRIIGSRYIAIYNAINSGDLSVCGTLINTQTGRPIEGATVLGVSAIVGTDASGFFQLDGISANETITISYFGFDIKRINGEELAQQEGCPLIFANISVNFLDTIVLENYITKGISKNADGSVSLSRQNFEILPSLVETDVLQIAQILPGIESADETAGNINIRGGKNDEVLVLWNDIRMYQTSHFFGLISALNPNLTNEVTIYKNGTHPRYGESTSGVISITSNDVVPEQVTGGAGINLISANLFAKIPVSETFAFNISGRTSINSGIGNPVYSEFFSRIFQNTVITNLNNNSEEGLRTANENFNFFDLSVKGIWDISEKDKLTYSFLGISNNLDFTELFVADTNSSSNQSTLDQSSNVNGIQWRRNWSEKFSSKINWHGSTYDLKESNREVNTDSTTAQRNELSENEVKLEATYRFTKNLFATAGFAYTKTELINSINEEVDNNTQLERNAYFLNGRWKSRDQNTLVSAGVRVSSYPTFNTHLVEPRFSLYQQLTKNLSLNISGEHKNQGVLQLTDLNNQFLGVENKRWILANNEDLPLLESEQISLGATFKKKQWTLTANAYYKKVDGISSSTQGFRNQFITAKAIGNYDAVGIELSVNKRTENLNVWLSYSFVESNYTFSELTPSSFPNNFAIRHSANVAATYSYRSFLFSLGSTYKTGNPFTAVDEGNEISFENNTPTLNFNAPNEATLDHYFRTDFSTAYTFKLDETFHGKINLALLNIFDRKNALDTYFRLQTDSDGAYLVSKVEQFSLGFTPNLSFQLLF